MPVNQPSPDSHSRKIKIWLEAARPKTLSAAVAPVLMGVALSFNHGIARPLIALLTLLCAVLIQVGTNFANDYYDYVHGADSEHRQGPRRATQAGLVPPATMRKVFIGTFLLTFLLGLFLVLDGGWPILLIGLFSILFGILYTGGPYPLGYNGWGDFFVLIFFGPVAVGGTYYLQTLQMKGTVLIAGLAPGLISVALLTVNNYRDIYTDRKAGKKTLVVRFGEQFAKNEYLLCLIGAIAIPIGLAAWTGRHFWVLITLLTLAMALPAIRTVFREPPGPIFNQVLAQTGKMLFLFSLLFSIGWVM